ncbi:MAG: FABP family protein [Actinomycetota bacterium]|nr:FABP family protein [Actinomycetota bacterium]
MSAPDSSDLRTGPPIHDALLALLPLVGSWAGTGHGVAPDGAKFEFGQQIRFVHDGRPFLAYESRAWLLDSGGAVLRQAWRESGFWRPGAGPDDIEVMLASNTGEALLYTGAAGDQRWDIRTASAAHAPTAKQVDAERRLYALTGDELGYASELAPQGRPLAPHLNGNLQRA